MSMPDDVHAYCEMCQKPIRFENAVVSVAYNIAQIDTPPEASSR